MSSQSQSKESLSHRPTRNEMKKAIRWFQKLMGIQDWEITLQYTDVMSEDIDIDQDKNMVITGHCLACVRTKQAIVWISPTRVEQNDGDIYVALFHECYHVCLFDLEIENNERIEFMVDRISCLFSLLYQKII